MLLIVALSSAGAFLGGWHAHKWYIRKLYKMLHNLQAKVRGK